MKKLYIIGPVTGKPNDNRPAFEHARELLTAEGYQVTIPHDHIEPGTPWNWAMRESIKHLLEADGVAMLAGTIHSKGASLEKQIAEAIGLPCYLWREYLYRAQGGAAYASGNALQPIFAPAC